MTIKLNGKHLQYIKDDDNNTAVYFNNRGTILDMAHHKGIGDYAIRFEAKVNDSDNYVREIAIRDVLYIYKDTPTIYNLHICMCTEHKCQLIESSNLTTNDMYTFFINKGKIEYNILVTTEEFYIIFYDKIKFKILCDDVLVLGHLYNNAKNKEEYPYYNENLTKIEGE